jgi:dihydrofolate synthase/folylpolyglutamate synthase
MRALLRALAKPQNAYRSIIVAGTNGKGSTCATMESILRTSGYRTGLYTSPHLVDLRERWTIDGQWIEPELLEASIRKLQRASDVAGIVPTYFEALTLIAFVAFADAGCEIAVLEVGMGGRLDATNVVRPIAALITPIGLDHTEYLGNTLRKIAAEKAGVIHRGAIALTTNDDPVVLDVLRARTRAFGGTLIVVRDEHDAPLEGDFQRHNVALAVRAAKALRRTLRRITPASIERGVAATRWRGRLEHFSFAGKEIWIDGAHNLHAARAIAPFVDTHLSRPRTLVFGIMQDKDVRGVIETLVPLFDRAITTEPYPPRSVEAGALAGDLPVPAVAEPDPRKAFERALRLRGDSILIAGSLYLAGAAIEYFDAKRRGRKREHQ